jgi:hypothetical protein
MNSRTVLVLSLLSLIIGLCIGGCLPGVLVNGEIEALYDEIQTLAADRSSTSDADCGVVYLGSCGCSYIVYSRAAVDEAVLLEKVWQYNELDDLRGGVCLACPRVALEGKSENGVCVARMATTFEAP